MIWFTSDLHLSHTNVLKHSNRPFASIEQMNEEIIKKWNRKVAQNDVIYVLGDVCWNWNSKQINETFSKMNGIKYLVIGNHDKLNHHLKSNVWVEITPYKRIVINDDRIVLCHYPIAEWDCAWRGAYHLYGHCHGNFNLAEYTKSMPHKNTRCLDVGVDCHNYEPWSWEEIKERLK